MKNKHQNKKSFFVACTLVAFISLSLFLMPFLPVNAQIVPSFGGNLIFSDFVTCSCGFVILTVDDPNFGFIRILYFYIPQLVELLSGLLPDKLPIPELYTFYNIFTPGVEVLGTFVPVPNAPCLIINPVPFTGVPCIPFTPGAQGYLFKMGTSLFPTI